MRAYYYVLQGTGEIIKAFRAYKKADVMNRYNAHLEPDEVCKSSLRHIKADPHFSTDRIIDIAY